MPFHGKSGTETVDLEIEIYDHSICIDILAVARPPMQYMKYGKNGYFASHYNCYNRKIHVLWQLLRVALSARLYSG